MARTVANDVSIPAHLLATTLGLHGANGQAWLDNLPTTLTDCAVRWGLVLGKAFENLTFNYATRATRADGTPVVMKACFPDRDCQREIAALTHFAGRGSVRLLEADGESGIFILEALLPGTPLTGWPDADVAAISIATGIMRDLWRPPPATHDFPTVNDWARGFDRLYLHFDGTSGPFPGQLVERAATLYHELAASSAAPVLLHGDLNFTNILAAQRVPWLAIDPKGVVGEPAYDAGVLLRDPLSHILSDPQPTRLLTRRIDQMSEELGIDRARVHGWGLAQAVLSAWWTIEDGGTDWRDAIACAEILLTC